MFGHSFQILQIFLRKHQFITVEVWLYSQCLTRILIGFDRGVIIQGGLIGFCSCLASEGIQEADHSLIASVFVCHLVGSIEITFVDLHFFVFAHRLIF